MSDVLLLSGRYASILGLCSGVTPSSANALYPAAYAIDGNPSNPWMASNGSSPQHLIFDLNHRDNTNGGFEDWDGGSPVGWLQTALGGTVLEENTLTHGGSAAAVEFNKTTSSQYALLYKDWEVPSGSSWQIRVWVRNGTAATKIYIQNLTTGQWLKPLVEVSPGVPGVARQWSPAVTGFHAFTASGLVTDEYVEEITAKFEVEDWFEGIGNSDGRLSTWSDTVKLRIMIGYVSTIPEMGQFHIDDFVLLPVVDFASIHYHNLRTRDRLLIQRSVDGSLFGDLAAFDFGGVANRKQHAWITFPTPGENQRRYLKLRAEAPVSLNVGGAFEQGPVYFGEVVLGQARTLSIHEDLGGAAIPHDWPQHRDEAGIYAYAQAAHPTLGRSLALEPRSPGGEWERSEEMADVFMRMYERSRGGAYSLVLVPDNTKSQVFFGRLSRGLEPGRTNYVIHQANLTLRGFPAPTPL